MPNKLKINVPVNRVEGDLEIRALIEDNVCQDAWCQGTMFRGIEGMLVGRGPLDGLVITPRICGICSTAHLTAATKAIEKIAEVTPPPKAIAIRNVALMTEVIQSDVRVSIMTFAPDFTHTLFQKQPLYQEARNRYETLKGSSFLDVLRESKRVLEIVAILGGQWPHSTFIVPGGVTSIPSDANLLQCEMILSRFRQWYEKRILGCSLERWLAVTSAAQLDEWLDESKAHQESEVGFLLRFGRAIGLDRMGQREGGFLSVGSLDIPPESKVTPRKGDAPYLIPPGYVDRDGFRAFHQDYISEDISHSWYLEPPLEGDDSAETKPTTIWNQTTMPYATGKEGKGYSWAKAPRYEGMPAETGPLAEALVSEQSLFFDLIRTGGSNVLTRQLARLTRAASLIPAMSRWLHESLDATSGYQRPEIIPDGEGVGLAQATRGALGHWVRLKEGKIDHYQVITPTTWNASPRDAKGVTGPIETALCGTPVSDPNDPVELGLVIRSFDPCLVCTVHRVTTTCRKKITKSPDH